MGCVRDGDTFRNVRFHDLRHGFVTEAGNIGHDSWAAYQVVGHEGENLRYAHLDRALYAIADDTARHIARYLDGRRVERDLPREERTNPVDYRARDRVVSESTLTIKKGRHW
jgi:integrase